MEIVSRLERISMSSTSAPLPGSFSVYSETGANDRCLATPCHTQDSICFYLEDTKTNQRGVFTGDTLFLAGCGRFFEGTPTEMHAALTKLGKLPDDTLVWNGHEYTKGSVKFGLKIEPENKELQGYVPHSFLEYQG
jgi:glyoxylase-like metal-dependent hydrolase (beta-lactamase superfamily II)